MTPPDLSSLLSDAEDLLPEVSSLRRALHAEPELGLELPATQAKVLGAIEGLDLEISTGGSTSAVVATLRGGRPGPTVLLRADMDALPMPEDTGLDYASRHEGRMHACGHDAHTAMLVGAAHLLARRRETLPGSVVLLFQPGEEGFGGARILVEDEGLLEREPRPEAAFAIHVDPTLRAGTVATRPGPLLACTDVFSIELTGRGGHASMPHHAVDPIPVACELVGALQSLVTRRVDVFDPAVLSVTKIESGSTHNVIPERAQLIGTTRAVSEPVRMRLREGIERIARGVCAAHEVEAKVFFVPGYPVTVNDADFTRFTRDTAQSLLGEERILDMHAPIMGAEDFSYILQKVPGAMVFLGARVEGGPGHPIHSNRMVLEERAMVSGMALHAAIAQRFLESRG